eukprot:g7100.t1
MQSLQNLPQSQQAEFMQSMELMQMQDSLRLYNRIVERCVCECVTSSMRTKKLDTKEKECISNCATKFVKNTQRVGRRFAEAQAAQAQAQGMQGVPGGGFGGATG